jgi:hypothetical protein
MFCLNAKLVKSKGEPDYGMVNMYDSNEDDEVEETMHEQYDHKHII